MGANKFHGHLNLLIIIMTLFFPALLNLNNVLVRYTFFANKLKTVTIELWLFFCNGEGKNKDVCRYPLQGLSADCLTAQLRKYLEGPM